MPNQRRPTPGLDRITAMVDLMRGPAFSVIDRLEGSKFSTPEFIEVLLTDPDASAAYAEAIGHWGESEHAAKMVVHGQVVPAILRDAPGVEWLGFAHGVTDPYAVPAWWRLVREGDATDR